ncbi:MAG: polysaccharide deacetylase family protein [Acidobacteriota bacterium]
MRVTSHCANHPSREASQRCRSCGKWLCDRCLHRYGSHVFCGRRCQIEDLGRRALKKITSLARGPLHPAWAIAVAAGASALLLTAVGLKVAEVLEVSGGFGAHRPAAFVGEGLSGRIVVKDGEWRVELRGRPGETVLVLALGRPIRVVTINEEGQAEVKGSELEPIEGPLRIVPLAGTPLDLGSPPRSSAASTPTETASPIESPGPTPSPTAEPQPVPIQVSGRSSKREGPAAGPTPAVVPPLLQLVDDAGPRIAITFDGNASSNGTADLLDTLHRHGLHVTLFVTGEFIERNPAIVRRALLAGHEVGNHTFSHPHLTTYAQDRRHRLLPGMTKARFQDQLRRTEAAFFKATGRSMRPLWRAPYGEENRLLRGWAFELGYLHVRWSSLEGATLDSHDWIADEHSSLYRSSSRMMERLLSFPRLEGGIILMHLSTERDEPPWRELPAFLEALRERDLDPTTITDLLEASPTWRPWLQRAQTRHRETFKNR